MDRNVRPPAGPHVTHVALRKESVDRNLWWGVRKAVGSLVALRKESVDRNFFPCIVRHFDNVALRKESVDRNDAVQIIVVIVHASLSARRAWIEILGQQFASLAVPVALRKESVDRNTIGSYEISQQEVALRKESVDRNTSCTSIGRPKRVALRKESVDRNVITISAFPVVSGRSPQGERG